jgi:hypothetical protein
MNCHCGCSVHDIDCNCYRFSPKVIWKILFIQHGTCYFFNVPNLLFSKSIVATPLWRSVRMTFTLSKWGLESPLGLPKTQSSIAGVKTLCLEVFLHTVDKVLKCRCRKWPCMCHSDIYSTSYGRKNSWESNWQFDSRPLKVGNRPDPGVCWWSATRYWKILKESYKFALDLILIKGLSKELWTPKVTGVQIGTVLELLFGSPGKKCHSNVGVAE